MKVQGINEVTTTYSGSTAVSNKIPEDVKITVFPNPASDLVAVQLGNAAMQDYQLALIDMQGKVICSSVLFQGSTISFVDTRTCYEGQYILQISSDQGDRWTKKVEIIK
jgi:hypothetical protein